MITQQSFQIAGNQIGLLFDRACNGDIEAANELVSLATVATATIEQLYAKRPDILKEAVRMRDELPLLHYHWTDSIEVHQRMLHETEFGKASPFRGSIALDDLNCAIVQTIYPVLEDIRRGNGFSRQILPKTKATARLGSLVKTYAAIQSLPRLSKRSVARWAHVASEYFVRIAPEMSLVPDTWLYDIANPEYLKRQRIDKHLRGIADTYNVAKPKSAAEAEKILSEKADGNGLKETRKQATLRKAAICYSTKRMTTQFKNRLIRRLPKILK